MGPENEEWVKDTSIEKLDELQDESSEEEALSLCDLPVNHNAFQEFAEPPPLHCYSYSSVLSLRPQQPAVEVFEFITSNSDMCPADDIIVSGKLISLKDNQCHLPKQTDEITPNEDHVKQNTRGCRRSESLSELRSASHSSNSIKAQAVRSSRSVDDKRHRRSYSSFVCDQLNRNCSKAPKSRWQLLISGIGMVKFPPEMELRDIKNRQSRRSTTNTLLSGSEAKSKSATGSTWGLIKALSCKDHTSISVTTSFVCMPHI